MPSHKSIAGSHPKNHYAWPLFLLSAAIILILSPLFQKGTFIDGMLYKTVAYNYAEHFSTFWSMKFTDTSMRYFCEQPPMYFYLLGLFYRMFGTGYLTDRIFTLMLLIFLLLVLRLIINQLFKTPRFYFYLTVFFVLSVAVLCWSYVNQVIEPLVAVLTLVGIYLTLRYIRSNKSIYILLFFINLYFLFLSKGFQSCFIVAFPAIYFLLSGLKKKQIYIFFASAFVFALALWCVAVFYQPSANWFKCYYNTRLVLTMNNVGNTTDNHLEIIFRFFTELLIPLVFIILLTCYTVTRKRYPLKFIVKNFISNKIALALLLTSLFGSVPYAMSLVQRGFYLIPAILCFLLAMVYGLKRYWLFLAMATARISQLMTFRILVLLIFSTSVMIFCYQFNSYKRDQALSEDLAIILPYLQKRDTVLIEEGMWNYFTLHASLYMAKQISLTTVGEKNKFFLCKKLSSGNPPVGYKKINTNTSELDLFFKK